MRLTLQQHARTHLPGPPPLDLLTRFSDQPLAMLYSGDQRGHTVIARRPLITLTSKNQKLSTHFAPHFPSQISDDSSPGHLLDQWQAALQNTVLSTPHHPLTAWIGFLSYDIAHTLEAIPPYAVDDLGFPLLHWQLFEEYFLFDHASRTWSVIVTDWPNHPESSIEGRLTRLAQHVTNARPTPRPSHIPPGMLVSAMPRDDYLRRVLRIKDYIAAGDIFQANFAQRWSVRTAASPIDLFRQLMNVSPSAYAALLVSDPHLGPQHAVISASPELLLHRRGTHLLTHPIKGTRRRDLVNSAHDRALHDDLLHSPKDQAELAMIVDLLRNDLGRIARFGSVRVTTPRVLEALPTLWHASAEIEAELFAQTSELPTQPSSDSDPRRYSVTANWSALMRALMPGGSITGAPKIRAMQIIEELEPTRRGLYCGAIGAISAPNNIPPEHPTGTFNIAIRTIQMINGLAYLHAGGGIVADSDPQLEYEETLHKAGALLRALNVQLG